jgi:hypothetical protein
MKVKDLISKLLAYDPEAPVMVHDSEWDIDEHIEQIRPTQIKVSQETIITRGRRKGEATVTHKIINVPVIVGGGSVITINGKGEMIINAEESSGDSGE